MDKENTVKDAEYRSTPSTEPNRQGEKEDWIGRQLRRVFDSALSEPLPDDIMSLLDRIDDTKPAGTPESAKGST